MLEAVAGSAARGAFCHLRHLPHQAITFTIVLSHVCWAHASLNSLYPSQFWHAMQMVHATILPVPVGWHPPSEVVQRHATSLGCTFAWARYQVPPGTPGASGLPVQAGCWWQEWLRGRYAEAGTLARRDPRQAAGARGAAQLHCERRHPGAAFYRPSDSQVLPLSMASSSLTSPASSEACMACAAPKPWAQTQVLLVLWPIKCDLFYKALRPAGSPKPSSHE